MSEGCTSTADTATDEEDNESSCVEQVVLSVPEVFVYKVPPLRTASGHRAEEWGLATPLFTGYLRVLQADTKLRIIVYAYRDPTKLLASDENLAKFGECPVEVAPHGDVTSFVDSVIDSSRYYVLRIKDPASSRTTLLGIGFREREVAFDFKSVLNEYVRYVDRMDAAKKLAERRAAGDDSVDVVDLSLPSANEGQEVVVKLKDLTLKEGDKLKIPIPGKGASKREGSRPLKSFGSFGALSPPPAPGSTVFSSATSTAARSSSDGPLPTIPASPRSDSVDGDEEWGEFS